MDDNNFNLDHFYTSFPQNDFDSLKQLAERWKNVRHTQTSNEIMSNEGVYIMTKDGHYIELLNREKTPEKPNLIAVNTFASPLKDETDLQAILGKKLNWKKVDQVSKVPDNGSFVREDIGKDWFYVRFIEKMIAEGVSTGIWLIDYQDKKFNRTFNSKTFLPGDYDFKQVLKVNWSLDSQRFEAMKSMDWATNDFKTTGDTMQFSLNNPNGKPVKFEFKENNDRKPGFEAITLEKIDKNKTFSLPDTSFIELIDENEQLTLKFNEY